MRTSGPKRLLPGPRVALDATGAGAYNRTVIVRGETLVVADLHLRSSRTQDDDYVFCWLQRCLRISRASSIIFAGDTFELSFVEREDRSFEEELAAIVAMHKTSLERLLAPEGVQEVIFLVGDHDFRLPQVDFVLRKHLGKLVKIRLGEVALHEGARAMILHGHQFDLNRADAFEARTLLTERLGEAFDRFIYDGTSRELAFEAACERGLFSFWYGEGALAEYISILKDCFGYDAESFWSDCAGRLRESGLRGTPSWLDKLSRLESIRRLCSMGPRWMFLAACMSFLVFRRCPGVTGVLGESRDLKIKYLVVGHLHRPRLLRRGEDGGVYVVASPRLHVAGRRGGEIVLSRDGASAIVRPRGLEYREGPSWRTEVPERAVQKCGGDLSFPG